MHKLKISASVAVFGALFAAFATSPEISETFEEATDLTSLDSEKWDVCGSIVDAVPVAPQPAGYPIKGEGTDEPAHTKALFVDGSAVMKIADDEADAGGEGAGEQTGELKTNGTKVDLMVKVEYTDDVLVAPADDEIPQIAVAIGKHTKFDTSCALCVLQKSGEYVYWVKTGKTFTKPSDETNQWVRVSIVVDNTKKTFRVLLDGEPVRDATLDTLDFGLCCETIVCTCNVEVRGLTQIDDVVVASIAKDAEIPKIDVTTKDENGLTDLNNEDNFVKSADDDSGVKVDKQWLSDNGVAWTSDAVNEKKDASDSLTYAGRFAAGFDGECTDPKLIISDMDLTEAENSDDVQLEVALPVENAGLGYCNVVQTSEDGTTWTDASEACDSKAVLTFPSANNLKYYRVVTKPKNSSEEPVEE